SNQVHVSIIKALDACGIGRNNIRLLPVNGDFKLVPGELAKSIEKDKKRGLKPFCVIGTAGTTSTGSIDPLEDIALICRQNDLWFHVDGAYGGFANLTDEGKEKLKGIELADSVTLDPHKWLMLPYEIGCIVVKNKASLKESFSIVPPYLKEPGGNGTDGLTNYYEMGIQLSRQFRALKLWMALKYHGITYFENQIKKNFEMARLFYSKLSKDSNFQILTKPQLSVVCFRYNPPNLSKEEVNGMNRELYGILKAEGKVYFSTAVLKDQFYLRACFINFRTGPADLDIAFEELQKTAFSIMETHHKKNSHP
ncbi:MAG: pyridoxal phosphate-dependent decarboxylase family protein, partial [Candidatus Hodarchaeales archaeon]